MDEERRGDPDNTIEEGSRWVSDDRKTFVERNDNGTTTFHRNFGGEWHSYRTDGGDEAEEAAEEGEADEE
jgi:hypothetical protein